MTEMYPWTILYAIILLCAIFLSAGVTSNYHGSEGADGDGRSRRKPIKAGPGLMHMMGSKHGNTVSSAPRTACTHRTQISHGCPDAARC